MQPCGLRVQVALKSLGWEPCGLRAPLRSLGKSPCGPVTTTTSDQELYNHKESKNEWAAIPKNSCKNYYNG